MASFWTKLFGANEIVDMVKDGVDAAIFTPEERAKHYLDVLKFIEPFKVAQRWLALMVLFPYVLIWFICALLFMSAMFFDAEQAARMIEICDKLAARNNDNLGTPASLIAAFYFGGGMLEGAITKIKQKAS